MVARLRRHPGKWILLPEMRNVPDGMVDVIRNRRRRALRMEDGVIRCRTRASVWLPDGQIRRTLILKWEPAKPEKE